MYQTKIHFLDSPGTLSVITFKRPNDELGDLMEKFPKLRLKKRLFKEY